jgi:hypothetical protein
MAWGMMGEEDIVQEKQTNDILLDEEASRVASFTRRSFAREGGPHD